MREVQGQRHKKGKGDSMEKKFEHEILRDRNRNRRENMAVDKAKRRGVMTGRYIAEPFPKGIGVFALPDEVAREISLPTFSDVTLSFM